MKARSLLLTSTFTDFLLLRHKRHIRHLCCAARFKFANCSYLRSTIRSGLVLLFGVSDTHQIPVAQHNAAKEPRKQPLTHEQFPRVGRESESA